MKSVSISPRLSLCVLGLLVVLSSCGGDGGNGRSTIAPDSGFLTLALTDAPVDDAAEVIVVLTGLELQRGPESTINIDFDTPRSIDLLTFRDGKTVNLVEGAAILPGNYQWLRLKVRAEPNLQDGSRIRLRDGRQFPLYIPSGAESGLKLNRAFVVAQGSITRLLIDFDLRKSVVAPPGQTNWFLRPSLRLVDQLQTGTLTGTVDVAGLANAQQVALNVCRPGIYVFRGAGVTPDDMDGDSTDGVDPVVYQPLTPTAPGAAANYTVYFLESDDYTVAATCQFDVDADPARSEFDPTVTPPPGTAAPMRFIRKNVRVTTGATVRADFP